jgi:hypothetical protein
MTPDEHEALLDRFMPMPDRDGELDLLCPLCPDWIDARLNGEWLDLAGLRALAGSHLREKHTTVINGELGNTPSGVAVLLAGQPRQELPGRVSGSA